MKRIWLIATGVLLIVAVTGLFGCTNAPTTGNPPGGTGPLGNLSIPIINGQQVGLFVSGQGQVMGVPDVANLSLGVQAQAGTVAEAQSQAVKAMNDMMTALTGSGVAAKDIQTQNFNIQQLTRYDNNKQQNVVIGYQVTNTVNAKVRALDKVGTIIDAVAKAGGDVTRINSISFGIDDPTLLLSQARQKAMSDAKSKADQLASAAGIKLGKPTYITESSYQPQPPTPIFRSGAAAAPAMETPISAGELTVTVNVQIVYPIAG
ncbi:MAG: SIMPL domain-containing protein [Dehalococcoidales bacterium]|nr:SIMPL domain-containing protein [Dehalococcoidales bacterium]